MAIYRTRAFVIRVPWPHAHTHTHTHRVRIRAHARIITQPCCRFKSKCASTIITLPLTLSLSRCASATAGFPKQRLDVCVCVGATVQIFGSLGRVNAFAIMWRKSFAGRPRVDEGGDVCLLAERLFLSDTERDFWRMRPTCVDHFRFCYEMNSQAE